MCVWVCVCVAVTMTGMRPLMLSLNGSRLIECISSPWQQGCHVCWQSWGSAHVVGDLHTSAGLYTRHFSPAYTRQLDPTNVTLALHTHVSWCLHTSPEPCMHTSAGPYTRHLSPACTRQLDPTHVNMVHSVEYFEFIKIQSVMLILSSVIQATNANQISIQTSNP